ncbi:D-alanyl-D-alanine carboxypeptidase/D-alanyl-D-alanine-endopeptidase [Enemella evansiae]|nr:D-alanyl-D-alanine carboxypeptidase/D-alanyl-D-alanine-endopeptidase [Enemella evansiae]
MPFGGSGASWPAGAEYSSVTNDPLCDVYATDLTVTPGSQMPNSRRGSVMLRAGLLMAVVVLVVVGLVTGVAQSLGRKGLYATGLWVDGGASTIDPSIFDHDEQPAGLPPQPAAPVLEPATPQPGTRAARVAERIAAVGPIGGRMMGQVVDEATGEQVYANNIGQVGTPASTLKTLTTVAALDAYGPDQRFSTTVRRDPADPGKVYLVGGGDPYLLGGEPADGRASILTLARSTAEALQAQGQSGPVEVVTDNTLFSGPTWNPDWLPGYRDYAADTSALWIDGARINNQAIGPRDRDPARGAGNAFAAELGRRGVQVTAVNAGSTPQQAAQLAQVQGLPLERIVEQILIYSDNDAAEVLFRHVGRTGGRSGSITESQAAMQQTLTRLGAWTDGMRIVDGSGLARSNLASVTSLTRVVQLAVSADHPQLRALATGMSVAGVEGTLAGRYLEDGTQAGRGLVRAKTGTLTRVHSMAGYVRAGDGALLVYSFIINDDQNEYADRVWLDRVTTALASCGCS